MIIRVTRVRRIETTDGKLACHLSDGKDYTHVCARHMLDNQSLMLYILQVTLEKADGNNSSQGWIFCPA